MPRIILKCPYFKSGSEKSAKHIANLVQYIATRDGVEVLKSDKGALEATAGQQETITLITKKFPTSKNLFEYEDYEANRTIENASEFISVALEQNLDQTAKLENYVGYIACRPRVQKTGSHGLFTGTGDLVLLADVAREVKEHTGNIWTPIISLRRDDAARLGYDDVHNWQTLISSYAAEMACHFKIHPCNLRWYAAFHNEGHHPHVHMICYSADPKEGYLTKSGIEKMKSGLAARIFRLELMEVYQKQTVYRNSLAKASQKTMEEIILKMQEGTLQNPRIEQLISYLVGRLSHTSGKKQYGYLKAPLKAVVDEIVDELAKDARVSSAYTLWQEKQNEVLLTYVDKPPHPLPLSRQKEFKMIRNMVIKEAMHICSRVLTFEDDYVLEEDSSTDGVLSEAAKNGDARSAYLLANRYAGGTKTEKNMDEAAKLFSVSAEKGNPSAQYALGKLYLLGEGVEKDKEMARKWFAKSAEQGNTYARFFLERMDLSQNPSVLIAATRMLRHMSRIFSESTDAFKNAGGQRIDKKRMQKLRQKKMAQGHAKDDHEQEQML